MAADFRFPMKPAPVNWLALGRIDLSKYTMEPKMDGWRAIVTVGPEGFSLWTRQKNRIKVPANLRDQLAHTTVPEGSVMDGEIWNPAKRGSWDAESGQPCVLTLWDCVRRGHEDISGRPIEERRGCLSEVLGDGTEHVRQVEVLEASVDGARKIEEDARAFRQADALRSGYVHGVVLKRRGSPRRDNAVRSTEHPDWLKLVFGGMKGWEA